MRAADELIECIVSSARIPSGKRRREVQRELRSHVEDFVLAAREGGHDEDEIERLLIANFGDAGQIASGFAWVYRHDRRTLRALAYILSTVLLASCLSAAVLAIQASLAFGFGTPVVKVLASRHTVIETLDILASVAAYLGAVSLESLFENHRFQRAALLLTLTFGVVMAPCAAMGVHPGFLFLGLVNGVCFRAIQLSVTPKLARAGIVVGSFPLAVLVSVLLRSPFSQKVSAATCASWLVMGTGYLLMTHLAARVDTALLNGLQGIHEG